jgi:hypothetical protein
MKPIHLFLALGLAALAGVYAHSEPASFAAKQLEEPIPNSALDSLDYESDPHAGFELGVGDMPDDEVHRPLRAQSQGD